MSFKVKKNFPLKKFTTLRIGGPARYFAVAKTEIDLADAVNRKPALPWYVVGEGSNLVVADRGFRGLIIQNQIKKFELKSRFVVNVGAGNNLLELIWKLNRMGLSGLERMAGIPGTVGGAIYGSAGAYGQEIKDRVLDLTVFDGRNFRKFSKKQCEFGYRTSIFKKHKTWIITDVRLKFGLGDSNTLLQVSREIIKLRTVKYPVGLRCPGSFFKNIKLSDLRSKAMLERLTSKIDPSKVVYGKIPVGYLLEQVGAKGQKVGMIKVASHHGNLIYNPGGGKGSDVKKLAKRLKTLVKNKFGITMEEEIQYLGF